jgi:hypothetical protein
MSKELKLKMIKVINDYMQDCTGWPIILDQTCIKAIDDFETSMLNLTTMESFVLTTK